MQWELLRIIGYKITKFVPNEKLSHGGWKRADARTGSARGDDQDVLFLTIQRRLRG